MHAQIHIKNKPSARREMSEPIYVAISHLPYANTVSRLPSKEEEKK